MLRGDSLSTYTQAKVEDTARQKACTKTKNCQGKMIWTPLFRNLGTKDLSIYRPAWVCDTCRKHDYTKGSRPLREDT